MSEKGVAAELEPRGQTIEGQAIEEVEEGEREHTGGKPPADISLDELEKLGRLRCTVVEAAAFFKCSKRTVQRYLKESEYADAWERGQEFGRLSLRRLQWRHANGSGASAVQMTIHLSKHWLGENDKVLNEMSGKNGGPIPIVITPADTKL